MSTTDTTHLLADSRRMIRAALDVAAQRGTTPAILYSGGKDSTLLRHLVREVDANVAAVLYLPPATRASRWEHALRSIDELTELHGPRGVVFQEDAGEMAVYWAFPLSQTKDMLHQQLVINSWSERLCLRDVADMAPEKSVPRHGLYFSGQRADDLARHLPGWGVPADFIQGPPAVCFPLRNWSDDNIWEAIDMLGLEVDPARYANRISNPDHSNDVIAACTACMDKSLPDGVPVHCPKLDMTTLNQTAGLPWMPPAPPLPHASRSQQSATTLKED